MKEVLPKDCIVNRFIPKKTFYEKTNVSVVTKTEFIDIVDKITWKYKLAEDTINITKTDEVEEIEIFEIELKEKKIPRNVINTIVRAIPYKILFILSYKEEFCYMINANQNYYSKWNEEIEFDFSDINLEYIYQNIVKKLIKHEDNDNGNKNFQQILENNKKKEELNKRIDILKNKVKNEKQFNKKVEFNQELRKLESELEELINE